MSDLRWRDRPRPTLRKADRTHVSYAILTVGVWIAGVQYLAASLFGFRDPAGSDWRPGQALFGLGSLAIAVPLTRLAVLYVRRPLFPEDELTREHGPPPPDVALREAAEETARAHRLGPDF